ncbi:MAG: hypothetical protein ACTHYN_02540 [Marinobacter sp.]|uniref:hypothetical protein n=1 Tax=Marinobacter sp. TaxID=50741 RepID=UPI003F9CBA4A
MQVLILEDDELIGDLMLDVANSASPEVEQADGSECRTLLHRLGIEHQKEDRDGAR